MRQPGRGSGTTPETLGSKPRSIPDTPVPYVGPPSPFCAPADAQGSDKAEKEQRDATWPGRDSWWDATLAWKPADKTKTPWPSFEVEAARAEARREMLEGPHTCVKCGLHGIGPSQFVFSIAGADEQVTTWCRNCHGQDWQPTKPKMEAWGIASTNWYMPPTPPETEAESKGADSSSELAGTPSAGGAGRVYLATAPHTAWVVLATGCTFVFVTGFGSRPWFLDYCTIFCARGCGEQDGHGSRVGRFSVLP